MLVNVNKAIRSKDTGIYGSLELVKIQTIIPVDTYHAQIQRGGGCGCEAGSEPPGKSQS